VSKTENRERDICVLTCLDVTLAVRMDHVCITVRDVDRSIAFYSKGLGFKLLRVSVLNPSPGTVYKNAYMYSDTFLLELITAEDSAAQPRSPESWQKTMRESVGIAHLGMRVRDLDCAISRLKAAGATMINEPFKAAKETTKIVYVARSVSPRIAYAKRPGKKAWRIAVLRDPDGVIIELVER
jgi:catechol 2,3-dioxygenase-like lactoylglutathione lyase family enzyme